MFCEIGQESEIRQATSRFRDACLGREGSRGNSARWESLLDHQKPEASQGSLEIANEFVLLMAIHMQIASWRGGVVMPGWVLVLDAESVSL